MFTIAAVLAGQACSDAAEPATLMWYGDGAQTWDEARAGLDWSLSNLGAVPPAGGGHLRVLESSETSVRFSVDLGALGLSSDAVAILQGAAREVGPDADVGRFLMRTQYEPWRYYAITGACHTLDEWRARWASVDLVEYAVTNSLLVEMDRRVRFDPTPPSTLGEIRFLAETGGGSLADATFEIDEFEVVDVMANGQQRFAIYSPAGDLLPGAPASSSPAGQPGKCMWCHEGSLMIGDVNPLVEGYLAYSDWLAHLQASQAVVDDVRAVVPTAVDFENYAVHTWSERLVGAFLRPTPARVAAERGWSLSETQAWVDAEGLTLVPDPEYPDLGPTLSRAELDEVLAVPIRVLGSERETLPGTASRPDWASCGT